MSNEILIDSIVAKLTDLEDEIDTLFATLEQAVQNRKTEEFSTIIDAIHAKGGEKYALKKMFRELKSNGQI